MKKTRMKSATQVWMARAASADPALENLSGLEEAWMRLTCRAQAGGASPSVAAMPEPGARRARLLPGEGRTPAARRLRHPSVVARLRTAQRFRRHELKDVPHA